MRAYFGKLGETLFILINFARTLRSKIGSIHGNSIQNPKLAHERLA